jgi:hypothetical protein
MPKTRSGKIMRRVLGALSNNRDVGDVMTLANPEIVEEIKQMVQEITFRKTGWTRESMNRSNPEEP